ncbi:MAG TPA: hypothetical protein VMC08_08980 [Bacteroidales bacterium]|nr:hypothetical protein [Bacteroidales bacterium]
MPFPVKIQGGDAGFSFGADGVSALAVSSGIMVSRGRFRVRRRAFLSAGCPGEEFQARIIRISITRSFMPVSR